MKSGNTLRIDPELLDASSAIRKRDEYWCNCPYCYQRGKSSDTGRHLRINFEKDTFHCWRCGVSGPANIFSYILLGSLELEVEKARRILSVRRKEEQENREIYLLDSFSLPIHDLDYPVINYLLSRGISLDYARSLQLRRGLGRYTDRVIIPTFDSLGNCIYFTGRSILDTKMRYLNPDGSNKSIAVFGLNCVRPGDVVLIVEGPFTAICSQIRINNSWLANKDIVKVVSVFGKSMSDHQAKYISDHCPSSVLMMLDGDTDNRDRVTNERTLSRHFTGKTIVTRTPWEKEDLASVSLSLAEKEICDNLLMLQSLS